MKRLDLHFAVCRIPGREPDNWGTGFFVEPRGLLLTCAHVLDAAVSSDGMIALDVFQPSLSGVAPEPLRLQGRWLEEHSTQARGRDLALVELVSPLPEWICTLDVLADVMASDRRQVHSYGFPSNRPIYGGSADGMVVGYSWEHASRFNVLEIRSAELSGGFSGAPIVDSALNCVIGIMMATVNADQRGKSRDLTWAVPTSCIPEMTALVRTITHPLVQELERLAMRTMPTLLDDVLPGHESVRMEQQLRCVETFGVQEVAVTVSELMARLTGGPTNLLLITGNSGSGKTMLMRRTLPAFMVASNSGADERKLVPVGLHASKLVCADGGTAAEMLAYALAGEGVLRLPTQVVRGELANMLAGSTYRFVVMLDGLDELASRQQRATAIELIRDISISLHATGHQVIVSSRPVDELGRLQHGANAALVAVVAPIAPEERTKYFANLLGTEANDVERQFFSIGGDALEGSPLLIAFAVSIYSKTGTLPSSPLQMYTQYVDLMLDLTRNRQDAIAADRSLLAEVLGLLPALAHASLSGELSNEVARGTLERIMHSSGNQPGSALVRRQAAQLQLEAMLGMQLALYRDANGLRWRHQSIRDYFAGHYMVENSPSIGAWTKFMSAWRDDTQRGAIKFALLIRAEQDSLRQESLQAFAPFDGKEPDEDVLDFLFELMRFGAPMRREVQVDLIDATFASGIANAEDYGTCRRLFAGSRHPFEHLLGLARTGGPAAELLSALISNQWVSLRVRERLIKDLQDH